MNHTPNFYLFFSRLMSEYIHRFAEDTDYALAAARTNPEDLALKMTEGLLLGTANKDGKGVKAVCKGLGIKPTYKDIRAFINSEV